MEETISTTPHVDDAVARRCEQKIQEVMTKNAMTRAAAIDLLVKVRACLIADDVLKRRAQYAPWVNDYAYYAKCAK